MHQRNVLCRGQALHFAVAATVLFATLDAQNALQTGLDVEHAASHIHQRRIGDGRLARRQSGDLLDLFSQYPAWLTKAQHRQRIGNAFHHRQDVLQPVQLAAVAAYEQIELILHLHQLFAKCQCDRVHGFAIRANQAVAHCALLLAPGALELVTLLQGIQARTAIGTLGNIKQQVSQQLARRRALQSGRATRHQLTQFLIGLTQQLTYSRAVFNAADLEPFGHAGKNRPELGIGCTGTQRLKASKHIAQMTAVLGQLLTTDYTGLGHLQRLTQLAQLPYAGLVAEVGDGVTPRLGLATIQRRAEHRVLGQ